VQQKSSAGKLNPAFLYKITFPASIKNGTGIALIMYEIEDRQDSIEGTRN
jgi:hypothetical protein